MNKELTQAMKQVETLMEQLVLDSTMMNCLLKVCAIPLQQVASEFVRKSF